MFTTLLIGLSAALVVVTVLPLTRFQAWWVRVWDFPRVQLACAAVVLALAAGVLARTDPVAGWMLAVVCGVCGVSQLA